VRREQRVEAQRLTEGRGAASGGREARQRPCRRRADSCELALVVSACGLEPSLQLHERIRRVREVVGYNVRGEPDRARERSFALAEVGRERGDLPRRDLRRE
jgi:hypothetical protein